MKLRPDQVKNSKLSSKERSLLIFQTAFDILKFENRAPPVGPDVFPFQSTVSMQLGRLPRYHSRYCSASFNYFAANHKIPIKKESEYYF